MTSARKARASEMLAALAADRFLLFKEADLIALDIPYELRRETQNKVLRFRKGRPFNPEHTPRMTPAASYYWDHLLLARSQSIFHQNQRIKTFPAVKALLVKASESGRLANSEVVRKWYWHKERIDNWHQSVIAAWNVLTAEEAMSFTDLPTVTTWACDMPLLAPAPHCFYPLEETPERARQKHLLKWVIEDCGEDV
jgi:hypothetical protein